jgi:predicted nucleic acid-binding protein
MRVLIDMSVWIDYFRDARHSQAVDRLLEDNVLTINHLILTELIPSLIMKRQHTLIKLLKAIYCQPIRIDWDDLIKMQTTCLRKGINRVGIPDLIIAQNAIQNGSALYTLDKHFRLLSQHVPLSLLQE